MKKITRMLRISVNYIKLIIRTPFMLMTMALVVIYDELRNNTIPNIRKDIGDVYNLYINACKAAHVANLYWIKTGDVKGAYEIRAKKLMES